MSPSAFPVIACPLITLRLFQYVYILPSAGIIIYYNTSFVRYSLYKIYICNYLFTLSGVYTCITFYYIYYYAFTLTLLPYLVVTL